MNCYLQLLLHGFLSQGTLEPEPEVVVEGSAEVPPDGVEHVEADVEEEVGAGERDGLQPLDVEVAHGHFGHVALLHHLHHLFYTTPVEVIHLEL